jgi:HNH endonuclease
VNSSRNTQARRKMRNLSRVVYRLQHYNEIVPDHIEPKGMGGAWRDDHPENVQAVHRRCNLQKGSRRLGSGQAI